jgi:tRNA pseudouridine55 synthase
MTDGPGAGILNVDKPYGMTSMEVVRRIKRACGMKKGVGHGGTLDPIATGVIPVCIGQATRVMEYLFDGSKEYTCRIQMGVSTDTYDAMGEIVAERDPAHVTCQRVESALEKFQGDIAQIPPMYSALKRQGKRLYELAREGVALELDARPVVVHDITLMDWDPPIATVNVVCGKGFYVRSLAHDLGESLGCGGHLMSLVRRRTGPFHLDDAFSLEDTIGRIESGCIGEMLHTPDSVLRSMPAMILGNQHLISIRNGRPLPAVMGDKSDSPDERVRAYGTDGAFVAILRFDSTLRQWRPDKVFRR